MVKKMKSTAEKATDSIKSSAKSGAKDFAGKAATLLDSQLANSVKDSAQHIWLAGMGAFSRAQEEGTKVFDALIKEGMSLQKKTQGLAEEKISEVTGKMSAMAGTVSAKAGQNWDKLEGIFEQRTAKAMNKLGVPTAKDVEALTQRVDQLAAAVAKLNKSGAVKVAPKAAVKLATKPAAKKAVVTPFSKAPVKRARKSAAA
jgi:poly(hydroxyalkanoate) granule-associated protein